MSEIRLPDDTQHVAIAGRTGSGKTVAGLGLLATRDFHNMLWLIIDHKRDDQIKALRLEELNINTTFLPRNGLYVVNPGLGAAGKADLEGLLMRAFKRGNVGVYVDEGHLVGHSEAVRTILVAGRSKRVPMIWTSQRAAWIDTFIWSQASFYRVFEMQTKHDIKRFEENFPIRWKPPAEYHSYYYDVAKGKVFYLKPSAPLEDTIKVLDTSLKTQYKAI